jgi:hypothetical protein
VHPGRRRDDEQEQQVEHPHRAGGLEQTRYVGRQGGGGVGHDPGPHHRGEPVRGDVAERGLAPELDEEAGAVPTGPRVLGDRSGGAERQGHGSSLLGPDRRQ